MKIILMYLAIMNVVAFIVYGIDKLKARRSQWRITESTLLWMAVAGGSIGAWMGMKIWRHKTLHRKFRYGVPAIIILQCCLATWVAMELNGHHSLLHILGDL